jgi:hypothetical protein
MLYRSPPPPDVSQGLQFISFSWTQTLVPMVFGVDAWLFGSHFGRIVAGAIGEAVAVPFIVWTILRKPAAGRAWILFGVTFLTMASLVDITRVSVFGPSAANDVRYVTLDAFFLPITLGLAFLPARGQTWRSARAAINPAPSPESGRNAAPTQARPPRRRAARWAMAIPALCTVVVLYAVALDFDQDRDTPVQWDYATRAFFKTFAASWADVASHADHPFLWDTEVNPVVINNAFYPYDTVSVTVGMLHTGLRFDAWGGTGFLLLSDGSVVPAVAVTQALGVVQGPPGVCVAAGAVPAGLSVPLNHALGAQRWFGLISYQSHTGAVVTESGGATVRFPRGSGTLLTSFPPTPMSSVAWGVPPHGSLCITRLKIILPAAEGTKPSTT